MEGRPAPVPGRRRSSIEDCALVPRFSEEQAVQGSSQWEPQQNEMAHPRRASRSSFIPLLLLFYISTLADNLPDEVRNSIFADYITIWANNNQKLEASDSIQRAVRTIEEWCKKKKMTLSDKSVVTFFSNGSGDAKWIPRVTMNGLSLKFDPAPKLLGIYMSRTLSIQSQVDKVVAKVQKTNSILACLSMSQWGWKKKPLRKIFLATQRSVLDYAAPAWPPWLANTQLERLDRAQNQALCRITGSPPPRIRCPELHDHFETTGRGFERESVQASPTAPRRIALEGNTSHRLCRDSWMEKSKRLEEQLPADLQKRLPLPQIKDPPWNCYDRRWSVSTTLAGKNRSDDAKDETISIISNSGADLVIYTDGSAAEGIRNGGAGLVVTRGSPVDPEVLHSASIKGRATTSSFEKEREAFGAALKWIEDSNCDPDTVIMICTDSQSLATALDGDRPETSDLSLTLDSLRRPIKIKWIPGHMGIPGNELADRVANGACNLTDKSKPITLKSAISTIKRSFKDPPPPNARTAATYANLSTLRDEKALLSRKDATMIARLRSGHSLKLAAYRNVINPAEDPTCPKCNQAPETLEHWLLECSGTLAAREDIFGTTDVGPAIISQDPHGTTMLAKRCLYEFPSA